MQDVSDLVIEQERQLREEPCTPGCVKFTTALQEGLRSTKEQLRSVKASHTHCERDLNAANANLNLELAERRKNVASIQQYQSEQELLSGKVERREQKIRDIEAKHNGCDAKIRLLEGELKTANRNLASVTKAHKDCDSTLSSCQKDLQTANDTILRSNKSLTEECKHNEAVKSVANKAARYIRLHMLPYKQLNERWRTMPGCLDLCRGVDDLPYFWNFFGDACDTVIAAMQREANIRGKITRARKAYQDEIHGLEYSLCMVSRRLRVVEAELKEVRTQA